MTIIRIRYVKRGGHYHCRLFTAPGKGLTFALCGTLVFDEREWPEVRAHLSDCEWLGDEQREVA